MSLEPCQCPVAGFCERYGRKMVGRSHAICQGTVLTEEACAAYKAKWDAAVGRITLAERDAIIEAKRRAPVGPARPRMPKGRRKDGGCCGKSLVAKAWDFAGVLVAWGKQSLTRGLHTTGLLEHRDRNMICHECPLNVDGWCKACDCNIKLKTVIPTSYCPTHRWFVEQPWNDVCQRNMLYFVGPLTGSSWTWNVAQVLGRIDLFDGKRVVAIAEGPGLDSVEKVKATFDGHRIDEWIVVPNHKRIREVQAFQRQLESVKDEPGVTWYGHTKGVTRGADPACRHWVEASYETTLDDWPSVERALSQYAMAGPFRRFGMFALPKSHRWHYSGTFYWFRNDRVFSNPLWQKSLKDRIGAEAWPGQLFPATETVALFADNVGNPYDISEWTKKLLPELNTWRIARGTTIRPAARPELEVPAGQS